MERDYVRGEKDAFWGGRLATGRVDLSGAGGFGRSEGRASCCFAVSFVW